MALLYLLELRAGVDDLTNNSNMVPSFSLLLKEYVLCYS